MEGLGNNSVILLALCLVFSLLLVGPLMWMCFLNLTYRLRKLHRTQVVKDRLGEVERGRVELEEEVSRLVRKVTWLEGVLAVADCEPRDQVRWSLVSGPPHVCPVSSGAACGKYFGGKCCLARCKSKLQIWNAF